MPAAAIGAASPVFAAFALLFPPFWLPAAVFWFPLPVPDPLPSSVAAPPWFPPLPPGFCGFSASPLPGFYPFMHFVSFFLFFNHFFHHLLHPGKHYFKYKVPAYTHLSRNKNAMIPVISLHFMPICAILHVLKKTVFYFNSHFRICIPDDTPIMKQPETQYPYRKASGKHQETGSPLHIREI